MAGIKCHRVRPQRAIILHDFPQDTFRHFGFIRYLEFLFIHLKELHQASEICAFHLQRFLEQILGVIIQTQIRDTPEVNCFGFVFCRMDLMRFEHQTGCRAGFSNWGKRLISHILSDLLLDGWLIVDQCQDVWFRGLTFKHSFDGSRPETPLACKHLENIMTVFADDLPRYRFDLASVVKGISKHGEL